MKAITKIVITFLVITNLITGYLFFDVHSAFKDYKSAYLEIVNKKETVTRTENKKETATPKYRLPKNLQGTVNFYNSMSDIEQGNKYNYFNPNDPCKVVVETSGPIKTNYVEIRITQLKKGDPLESCPKRVVSFKEKYLGDNCNWFAEDLNFSTYGCGYYQLTIFPKGGGDAIANGYVTITLDPS